MSGLMRAALAKASPRRSHRSGERVRRNSRIKGHCEGGFWKPLTKKDGWRLVVLAEEYDRLRKEPGKKNGPLGVVAIQILRYMINRIHQKTGQLDPSLQTIMTATGRCKDAVCKALKRLQEHGFIDWLRRYVPTGNDGSGPQVQQTSNAYRLMRPHKAEKAVQAANAPTPDDQAQGAQDKAAQRALYEIEEMGGRRIVEALATATSATGKWARGLLDLLEERESVKRTEPQHRSIL